MATMSTPDFAARAVSLDLIVGGACITLSSEDNTGFSFHPNEENGFDFDFANFTGQLRLNHATNSISKDISSPIATSEDRKVDESEKNGATNHLNGNKKEDTQGVMILRMQQYLDDNRTPSPDSAVRENELHLACARPRVSIRELSLILQSEPQAASQADEEGRYPLHVLSENTSLLSSIADYPRDASHFMLSLLKAYPEALFTRDVDGCVPFGGVIQEWIQNEYNESPLETRSGVVSSLFARSSSTTAREENPISTKFPKVTLPPTVMCAIKVLSNYLNCVNDCSNAPQESKLLVRAALAQQYATIPYLLKTVYLVEDENTRQEVIHSTIIQRIMYCSESVGGWLSKMLRHGHVPSKRAVDYVQDVTRITASDYIGVTSPTEKDTEAFEQDRELLFASLERAGKLVPSLTGLGKDEKARAATTDAVWTIINHSISRPLVIGILWADFVFNIMLLLTFRYATDTNFLEVSGAPQALSQETVDMLVLSLCLYFLIRKLSELFAVLRTSAFKSHYVDFWNVIDLSAVLLATAALLTRTTNAVFLALTMGMLWLKFLSYLTAVNMYLATFIMAVVEIVKDIRWFLVVLTLAIFMFGDVIQILTGHSSEDYCGGSDPPPPEFCNDEIAPTFLKLFAVLVGDMDLNEFKYSSGAQVLFLLFALLGIIILLNVLIAVVSDSYQKSVEHATQLFGRARLDFVVKMIAQETFLKGSSFPPLDGCTLACIFKHYVWFLALAVRFLALADLVWTAAISEYCLVLLAKATYRDSGWWVFCAIVAGVLFLLSVPSVLQGLVEQRVRKLANERGLSWIVTYLDASNRASQKCANLFFGGIGPLDDELEEGDVRVQRLENSMLRVASTTKDAIIESVEAGERRVKDHSSVVGERITSSIRALSTTDQ